MRSQGRFWDYFYPCVKSDFTDAEKAIAFLRCGLVCEILHLCNLISQGVKIISNNLGLYCRKGDVSCVQINFTVFFIGFQKVFSPAAPRKILDFSTKVDKAAAKFDCELIGYS